jgi:hypothetical protein
VVLFAICMYIMRCKSGTIRRVHQVAITSLFALATLGFIFGFLEENMTVKIWSGVNSESLFSKDSFNLYLTSQ